MYFFLSSTTMSFDTIALNVCDYYDAIREEYHCDDNSSKQLADDTFNYNWLLHDEIHGVLFVPPEIKSYRSVIKRIKQSIHNHIQRDDNEMSEKKRMEFFDLSQLTMDDCFEKFSDDPIMIGSLTVIRNEYNRITANITTPYGESMSADTVSRLRIFQQTYTIGDMIKATIWRKVKEVKLYEDSDNRDAIEFIVSRMLCHSGRSRRIARLNRKIQTQQNDTLTSVRQNRLQLPPGGRQEWKDAFTRIWPVWGHITRMHQYCMAWNRIRPQILKALEYPLVSNTTIGHMTFSMDFRSPAIKKRFTNTLTGMIQDTIQDLIKLTDDDEMKWFDYATDNYELETTDESELDREFDSDDVTTFFTDVLGSSGDTEHQVAEILEFNRAVMVNGQWQKLASTMSSIVQDMPTLFDDEIKLDTQQLGFFDRQDSFCKQLSNLVHELPIVCIQPIKDPEPFTSSGSDYNEKFMEMIDTSWRHEINIIYNELHSQIRTTDIKNVRNHILECIETLENYDIKNAVNQSKTLEYVKEIIHEIGSSVGVDVEMDAEFLTDIKTHVRNHVPPPQDHRLWTSQITKWTSTILNPYTSLKEQQHFNTFTPTNRTLQFTLFSIIKDVLQDIEPHTDHINDHQYNMILSLKQLTTETNLVTYNDYLSTWYYIAVVYFSYLN
jgi:hypothetical protein